MVTNTWPASREFRGFVQLKICRVKGSKHVKFLEAQSPHVSVVWKSGEGVPAQVSSSSLDRGSKLAFAAWGTLNSRRTASHLVRLVEGEERWEASDHSQGVPPKNLGWNRAKSYCHLHGAQI
ncbi:hypothetical protein TNCV_907761 [Trichonephila clavipes]|nr:hypothetical protein TNCV_907761 [Trichonephila clavipes]